MKKFTLLLSVVIAALFNSRPLSAQKLIESADGYVLNVTLDHKDAIYKRGEEIKVNVTLTCNGEPYDGNLVHVYSKDYYAPSKLTTNVKTAGGRYEASYSLDEPGFIHLRFTFKTPQGSTISQMVGAGVDPYKIKRSMAVPADFDKYWQAQKDLQAAIPMNIRLTPTNTKRAGIVSFDVQADCAAGNFSGYIAMPQGSSPKSLPAMVLCHGAGVASSRQSVAERWAGEGILVLDFNVHGLPNAQPRSYYQSLYKGELKQYYLYDTSNRDSLFFRKMIFRLLRAIDIVTDRPEWDGKNLIAFGRSQGGAQALIAGGLEPRVNLVCAEIPALCDVTGYAAHRMAGWPKWPIIDDKGNITDKVALNNIRYVDAINFVPKMKAKCYMTVGYIDLSCCATGVFAVYNEVPTEKHIYHHTRVGHRTTPEGEAFVRQAVLDFLNNNRNE